MTMGKRSSTQFVVDEVTFRRGEFENVKLIAESRNGLKPDEDAFDLQLPDGVISITVDNERLNGTFKPGQRYNVILQPISEEDQVGS